MRRPSALALLLLFVGACTATPIPLPGSPDLFDPYNKFDGAAAADSGVSDLPTVPPPGGDGSQWNGDLGHAADAAADGVCLECPLPDGMTDAGAPDAEAGTSTDGLTSTDALTGTDAQADLPGGDLAMGE